MMTIANSSLSSKPHVKNAEWVSLNELLFDVIRASLILEGASLERDLRMLGTLMGSAKDGRSIRKWAMQFADMNTVASQADLQSKLEVKLPAQACLTELESHSTKLWSSWLLISGNDPNDLAKLASFHYRWLNSLPSEPIGSHLSSVRKWLADKISENSTILCDVDSAIDIMIRYAASIGLTDSNPDIRTQLWRVSDLPSMLCSTRSKMIAIFVRQTLANLTSIPRASLLASLVTTRRSPFLRSKVAT